MALVLVGVSSERPDGEDVAVLRVRNAASAVEDAGDALLVPVAGVALLRDEVLDAALDRGAIGRAGRHQREQCPRGVDDARAAVAPALRAVLRVSLVVARGEVLAPAAVRVLLGEEEMARTAERVGVLGLSREHEALDAKPRAVGEAAAPRAVPRAVLALDRLDEASAGRDRLLHLARAVRRVGLVEGVDGRERRHRALDVRVVDHDVAKDLRRVEPLVPAVAAVVLVRRKPAVDVLQREDHVHRFEEALVGDDRAALADALQVAHREHGLEPLRRAVGDGPAVRRAREGPAALRHVPVEALAHRAVLEGEGGALARFGRA
mmetsp:Transcript_9676/g.30642  ORF Transcript_9676/g.30642 Transcript_9676/m.30642 type:complete len:321 (+) Transcript_9676:203-1165(+)